MNAMPATAPPRMTAEQFLALPEKQDASRYDLVDGEVIISEATPRHQLVVRNLLVRLHLWTTEERGSGFATLNINVGIDVHTVLSPDLQWYAADRELPSLDHRPWPLGDLVVEVRSPSTWHVDLGRKRQIYERNGVRELWLVDPPAQTVLVFRRSEGSTSFDVTTEIGVDGTLTSPLLPGFAVPVANVFG